MLNKTMRYMIKLLMKQARNTEPAKLSKAEALIKHYLMRAPGIHGLTTHPLLHKLSLVSTAAIASALRGQVYIR